MRAIGILLGLVSLCAHAQISDYDPDGKDSFAPDSLAEECHHNSVFLFHDFKVLCADNFHQYKSTVSVSSRRSKPSTIRIGEFNALHPGMGKTRFKDYYRLAKVIDQYDVIGLTELIPLVSSDLRNNESVLDFIQEAPQAIAQIKREIEEQEQRIQRARRVTDEMRTELRLLRKMLSELEDDQKDAASLYRLPGYLRILKELHSMPGGKSWSLILSPRGEGSELTSTPELVGYYYRSDLVQPKDNSYCKSINKTSNNLSFACIVNMDKTDLGSDKSKYFARRPFLAQFRAGNFEFVTLTSHILYDSPSEDARMIPILRAAFGVRDHTVLGTGLNKETYARFAEVKMTLDFIQRYKRKFTRVKDIIYLGDFNLEMDNQFWPNVLRSWSGAKLYISQPTSIKEDYWTSSGERSNGLSSNYDHIIFDPNQTRECLKANGRINGGALNFLQGSIAESIDRKYRVRYKYNGLGNIRINKRKYDQIKEAFVDPYFTGAKNIVTIGRKYITVGRQRKLSQGIIVDERETEEFGSFFQERVIDSQLTTDRFYNYFQELISDHLPVYVDCKI